MITKYIPLPPLFRFPIARLWLFLLCTRWEWWRSWYIHTSGASLLVLKKVIGSTMARVGGLLVSARRPQLGRFWSCRESGKKGAGEGGPAVVLSHIFIIMYIIILLWGKENSCGVKDQAEKIEYGMYWTLWEIENIIQPDKVIIHVCETWSTRKDRQTHCYLDQDLAVVQEERKELMS